MPREHVGIPPLQSSQGDREASWDPSSWYGDEDVLPAWARDYIKEIRRPLDDCDVGQKDTDDQLRT